VSNSGIAISRSCAYSASRKDQEAVRHQAWTKLPPRANPRIPTGFLYVLNITLEEEMIQGKGEKIVIARGH